MAYKHIQTELKDGVATLTLNRAPVNVLNIEMMEEINTYLEGLKKEKSLKLLVIQAVGKAFSAGVDVGEHLGDLVQNDRGFRQNVSIDGCPQSSFHRCREWFGPGRRMRTGSLLRHGDCY